MEWQEQMILHWVQKDARTGDDNLKQAHHENPLLKRPTAQTMLIGWVSYFGTWRIISATGSSSLKNFLGSVLKEPAKWAV